MADKASKPESTDEKSAPESASPQNEAMATMHKVLSYVVKSVEERDAKLMLRAFKFGPSLRKRLTAGDFASYATLVLEPSDSTTELVAAFNAVDSATSGEAPVSEKLKTGDAQPELYGFLSISLLHFLHQAGDVEGVGNRAQQLTELLFSQNRRSSDWLYSKAVYFWALAAEAKGELPSLLSLFLQAHRTACLRHNDVGQATIINLILRAYLLSKRYVQAEQFISRTRFPDAASNNQFVRYLFYKGKILATQLNYSEAYKMLIQALRKAPTAGGVGFRQATQKLATVVQLLMGELPDRSLFRQAEYAVALQPYLELAQALRIGDLAAYTQVVTTHAAVFETDDTTSLVQRLRQNVIRTGLKKVAASYSNISFADVAEKLGLESADDAAFIAAKAIRDGVIEAELDAATESLRSKEVMDLYSTAEPAEAFHKRILFCMDVRNDAVKAMQYPPRVHEKKVELHGDEQDEEELVAEINAMDEDEDEV